MFQRSFVIYLHYKLTYSNKHYKPPCLTLSNIRYVSRVKWSNPGKGVAPSPTPRCSSYWKESLLVALDYGRQLYFTLVQSETQTSLFWIWTQLAKFISYDDNHYTKCTLVKLGTHPRSRWCYHPTRYLTYETLR